MAFSSLVDDSRRTSAQMLAMGQSINIQRSPRPKPGTISSQKMTYTPAGSELEKMLYPKNFKPRQIEIQPQEKQETTQAADPEMIVEIHEQAKEPSKIIGDEDITVELKEEALMEEKPKETPSAPAWQRCRHYKLQGERAFCREYLGWCAKEKCSRPQP
jgi:hypothetical protein